MPKRAYTARMGEKSKYRYLPVVASDEVRSRVQSLAAENGRSVAQEGGKLLERGLEVYDRLTSPGESSEQEPA